MKHSVLVAERDS